MTSIGVRVDGGPAGVAAKAAALLRSEGVTFAPAAARQVASSRTLREAFLTALGCDRQAGPLAYWEWESLHASLGPVRNAIARHVDLPRNMDVERWANESSRSLAEVLKALDAVIDDEDEPAPAPPTLRPWCNPKLISQCRILFVPLAAITHAWGNPDRSWEDVAGELDLAVDLTSWDLLRKIDPVIRNTEPLGHVAAMAWDLRQWKGLDANSDSASPARWLFSVTAEYPSISLYSLLDRAHEEIDAPSA